MDTVKLHSPLRATETAIDAITFHIRRKEKAIAGVRNKSEISENDKLRLAEEESFLGSVKTLIKHFRDSYKFNLGKIPPADPELEETVLGAVILEKHGMVVTEYLKPEHFSKAIHEQIYTAILELKRQGQPVDLRTVVAQLRKDGHLDMVGGPAHVAYLTTRVTNSTHAETYARLMIEFAIKRQLIVISSHTMIPWMHWNYWKGRKRP
jgi:hypothetical protein